MQQIMQSSGEYKFSPVDALPFINLDQTKPSTIYTTLVFAVDECKKKNKKTSCIVTFDQPLCQKASEIVSGFPEELGNVIVRLGGFPLVDVFHGCGWQHYGWQWT